MELHHRGHAHTESSLHRQDTGHHVSANDSSSIELGTVFPHRPDGQVTAIRFYKGAGNTGTHTGSL